METLVIYGDFNCPFSALTSLRAAELEQRRLATIDWRAVQHDPDVPTEGVALEGEHRAEVAEHLDQVRGLLIPGEADQLRLPDRHVNTRYVTQLYASGDPAARPALRRRIFRAYWLDGADISDPAVIARLDGDGRDPDTAAAWQAKWDAIGTKTVPTMVLPGREAIVGVDVLAKLADRLTSSSHR